MDLDMEKLLFSISEPNELERLHQLRAALMEAAIFSHADPRAEQLRRIVYNVAAHGDQAVADYTEKFDHIRLAPEEFRISDSELEEAHRSIGDDLMKSIRGAVRNVEKYQKEIFIPDKVDHPGIKYTPIRRVGVCVPGASAPLASTVIMTAVPAMVAGVKEISVISPPRHNGSIHPVILGLCQELKIGNVFRVGGAQGVAALACGTGTIGKVDKIVGPGNQWVQMAKREVFGLVDIDSVAGPSEVLIIADESANPAWVAADMLSQVEHDPGSAVVFTDSQDIGQRVLDELKDQLPTLDRAERIRAYLEKFCGVAVFENMDEIIDVANSFAPEHLEIHCRDKSRDVAGRITEAGAVFIGPYTPVAVGDYWAGPSHTLPTGQTARFSSALTSNDFVKSISLIEYDKKTLAESADDIIRLAKSEGLDAHARSVEIRRKE